MFQTVKSMVNIVDVCEMYNVQLDRAYKAKCPFHNEKTASFSVSPKKQIFHCFGCGEGGDAITLVGKLFNLSPLDACKKINEDFQLGITNDKPSRAIMDRRRKIQAFQQWTNDTAYRLTEFRRKLFIEGDDTAYVDYLLDILRDNPIEFFKTYGRRFDVKWTRETIDACFEILSLDIYAKVVVNIDYRRRP